MATVVTLATAVAMVVRVVAMVVTVLAIMAAVAMVPTMVGMVATAEKVAPRGEQRQWWQQPRHPAAVTR